MKDLFATYLQSISQKYSHPETSEMGYRADFEQLLKGIFSTIKVSRIDHDARATKGNKPDFVVFKEVPILYIEAKDIGVSLDKVEKSEQMSRYYGYMNLVLTDYVEFRFYRNGVRHGESIVIGEYDRKTRKITALPEHYELLARTLIDFTQTHKEPIRSGNHLAKIMGGKAQRIRDNVRHYLQVESEKNNELLKLYEAIKTQLVHDLKLDAFADMYAQTLVYGLFAARYYDPTSDSFTRQEARGLVPKSNPLLRHFFDHIVGADFDERLEYIVDELCTVFSHANIKNLLQEYFQKSKKGDAVKGPDPVIHFYEDFLKEYDPELRKKMGAYYTPQPVVQFIVDAVDHLLKKEFGFARGLADTTKAKDGSHVVQILDPAVGTGTFISAVIGHIYTDLVNSGQKGRWTTYVHNELLPRIHGFELMMAPYTMAHLRLSIAFARTGFVEFYRRLGIYLTNALEHNPIQQRALGSLGLAESITAESQEAAIIKSKTPIMVVLGNPPYSVSSSNNSEWIKRLIAVYKEGLGERNINSLSDDYIKFIRLAEHFVEKNKRGIVAMITNNSFIDGITHRQMRKHLLETFDKIYVLDLHGNAKKKETAPDGGKDENVFAIQQGVSINIFVRISEEKKGLGKVYHQELYGKQSAKFEELQSQRMTKVRWKEVIVTEPNYFFVPKDFTLESDYMKGFKLSELFKVYGSGIKFRKDNLLVKNFFKPQQVQEMLRDMNSLGDHEMLVKYNFQETNDWKLKDKRQYFVEGDITNIRPVLYRPFDVRYTYYPLGKIGEIIPRGDSRKNLMKNLLHANQVLISKRGQSFPSAPCFVTSLLTELRIYSPPGTLGTDYVFPLYIESPDGSKTPNLDSGIVAQIEKAISKVNSEQLFDYIYAVLHSPSYRKKYAEFLKIDFPRIPYPKDRKKFDKLVALGKELRELHLMESSKIDPYKISFEGEGDYKVEKPEYTGGKVFINKTQFFGNVSEVAWNFYIGGYQPAQKWLKDRKGRTLNDEDITHYQKIVVVLGETERLMKKVDLIDID